MGLSNKLFIFIFEDHKSFHNTPLFKQLINRVPNSPFKSPVSYVGESNMSIYYVYFYMLYTFLKACWEKCMKTKTYIVIYNGLLQVKQGRFYFLYKNFLYEQQQQTKSILFFRPCRLCSFKAIRYVICNEPSSNYIHDVPSFILCMKYSYQVRLGRCNNAIVWVATVVSVNFFTC